MGWEYGSGSMTRVRHLNSGGWHQVGSRALSCHAVPLRDGQPLSVPVIPAPRRLSSRPALCAAPPGLLSLKIHIWGLIRAAAGHKDWVGPEIT